MNDDDALEGIFEYHESIMNAAYKVALNREEFLKAMYKHNIESSEKIETNTNENHKVNKK